ncbi:MAG TPA: Ku protein [Anaerolineae bacterium]|nr:Ku protein [Anaerolineae bacterium]
MRAMWSGAISFGLVNVPVKLYKASEGEPFDFDLLRRDDKCRIRYLRVCQDSGEEVEYEDIVKGYEYEDGRYIILETEDFQAASPSQGKTIEILTFVDEDDIDPKYLEQPYYLEPDEKAAQAYALLRDALDRTGKVAIARYMIRTRQHLGMIKAQGDVIILNQMRFAAEIRPTEELNLPENVKLEKRQMDLAVELIERMTEEWKPEEYRDTYVDALKEVIQQKIEGREIEIEEEPIPVEVVDLFSQLRRSLEMAEERKK